MWRVCRHFKLLCGLSVPALPLSAYACTSQLFLGSKWFLSLLWHTVTWYLQQGGISVLVRQDTVRSCAFPVYFWMIMTCCFLPGVDEDGDKASAKKRRVESFQQKEKRKRDLGQATSDKSFVEEEKRILRQNADWGPALVWSSGLAALSLCDCPAALPQTPNTFPSSPLCPAPGYVNGPVLVYLGQII